jgi:hypothetical protein
MPSADKVNLTGTMASATFKLFYTKLDLTKSPL